MTPELERFFDAATRPLEGNPEAREEVRAELMGRVSHQGVPLELIDVGEETAVLEKATSRPSPWFRRVAMLVGLVVCLILWGAGVTLESLAATRAMLAQQLSFHYRWGGSYGTTQSNDFLPAWQRRVAPDVPLTGDPARFPKVDDETRALRERFPEDLAVLQEHLARRTNEADDYMTGEERALVERLDPDNAMWLVKESEWMRGKAYGRGTGGLSYMARSTSVPVDADVLAEAWDLYQQAAAKTTYRDYSPTMVRREIESFPPDQRFMQSLLLSGYADLVFSAGEGRMGFSFSSMTDDFEKQVSTLVKDGDLEGLTKLGEAWERINRLQVHSGSRSSGMDVSSLQRESRQLADAFLSLNDMESSGHYEGLATVLSMVETKRYVTSGDPLDELMPIRGEMGYLVPRELTVDEVKPGRMAERAYFDRMLTWFGAFLLFLVVLACGFEAYRRSFPVKGMARGLMPLFSWRDQAWVAGLGVAAPWLYWWGVTRMTPLGFRKIGMADEWAGLGWMLQAAIALLLLVVMLVQTVQWRWVKRGAFLGFRGRVDWLGWVVAGMLALGLPLVGVVRELAGGDDEKGMFLLGMVGLALVGLLWLLWVGGMNLFTPRHSALRANLVSRSLLPWSIVSVALMLLCAGVLLQAEKTWYSRDTLFPLSTGVSRINGFEERAMEEIQASLQEVWQVEE
ncbi:hypothetical protein [Haloferula rosea]|uniref:Uncharacterized protein n=1 Tax=Haloferula rosea TaxID=490093 RepID=A0A934R7P8_9BACT|nr:hypothetical protein [Haloferula rosea]MBK1825430.1 hypothetical protein [Haloferula rosea]